MTGTRVAMLAANEGWHANDLRRAAALLGVEIERLQFQHLVGLAGGKPRPPRWDAVIVRSMPVGTLEQVIFRMDVLGCLAANGVRVVNAPRALETAIDKFLSAARIAAAGLPVPETRVAETAELALEALDALGGDVVLKPIFGSEGRGLERLASRREAAPRFAELAAEGSVIHLQRFVRHPGHDLRIVTLGARVLCAVRRRAREGWITNVARGGIAEAIEPTDEMARLALGAASAVGVEVAGVDLLPDEDGKLWVLEVNAVPGWRATAGATGIDVARAVLEQVLVRP